jgi:Spy/CpxP family protein refolding chaperone
MKLNRFFRTAGIAGIVLVFAAAVVWAQENEAPPPPGHHGHRRMMSPEDRTNHLAKALNLSDDQKGKVLSIFQEEQKQMEALRSDNSLSREDRWSKMKQIHENTVSQIKGTLNEDQAKKFDEIQQRMEQRREQRGQAHGNDQDNDNAPPPPQQ